MTECYWFLLSSLMREFAECETMFFLFCLWSEKLFRLVLVGGGCFVLSCLAQAENQTYDAIYRGCSRGRALFNPLAVRIKQWKQFRLSRFFWSKWCFYVHFGNYYLTDYTVVSRTSCKVNYVTNHYQSQNFSIKVSCLKNEFQYYIFLDDSRFILDSQQ